MAGFIGNTPTSTNISGLDISDGSIASIDIADNAVTLAKMASGTDGQIITYDASGDPVAVGPGTDGQVLTSTGAGSPPAFEDAAGGGAWTVITSTQASSSASVDFTSITNTYATYAVVISQAIPVTDNTTLVCRVGDSSGFDSAVGDYDFHTTSCRSNSSSYSAYAGGNDPEIVLSTHNFVGNGTDEGWGGIVYIHNPINASTLMKISSKGITTNSAVVDFNICAGLRTTAITCDRIQFFFLSGNISSGRFTLYGLAHS